MTQTHEPLSLPASAGLTAKEEEATLKKAFPEVEKGTTAEISAELKDAYERAIAGEAAYREYKLQVLNKIRLAIGSAQTATVDGIPVASRRVFKRAEYIVPETEIDAFWPANGKTS